MAPPAQTGLGRGPGLDSRLPSLLELPSRPVTPAIASADRYLKRSGTDAQYSAYRAKDHSAALFPDRATRASYSEFPRACPRPRRVPGSRPVSPMPLPLSPQGTEGGHAMASCVAPLRSPGALSAVEGEASCRHLDWGSPRELIRPRSQVFLREDANVSSSGDENALGADSLESEAIRLATVLDQSFDVL